MESWNMTDAAPVEQLGAPQVRAAWLVSEPLGLLQGRDTRDSTKRGSNVWSDSLRATRRLLPACVLAGSLCICLAVPVPGAGHTDADYVDHVEVLKRKLPSRDFSVVVQKPFVVIGDEPPAVVRRRAERTVKWATDRLKTMYFARDPAHIIDIWLFKNDVSYRKHTRALFGREPHTPFGYASTEHKALIMNIATGGGTLVHEIVHPFVAANFPECPAWFNEGLGSLYEQSSERGTQIVGLTNWRLAGLQKAIGEGRVPSFRALTSTTDHEFYEEDRGTNYAQARYLCYYLQEHGLLTTFYHKFKKNHGRDPTGYKTLKNVLGEQDMAAFRKKWEKYVLRLQFP